jgi:hypothetical protein
MELNMRIRIAVLCLVLALCGFTGFAQANDVHEKSRFVGLWRADADGLPFVTLNLTDESGTLTGAVLFYLHRRDHGQPVTCSPGIPEPLINPRNDGDTLTFQVSHRRAHPPGSRSDAPVSFRLRLAGSNRILLVNASEGGPQVELTRSDY